MSYSSSVQPSVVRVIYLILTLHCLAAGLSLLAVGPQCHSPHHLLPCCQHLVVPRSASHQSGLRCHAESVDKQASMYIMYKYTLSGSTTFSIRSGKSIAFLRYWSNNSACLLQGSTSPLPLARHSFYTCTCLTYLSIMKYGVINYFTF